MTQQRDTFADEEINLREYLLVLVRKWWVVVGVLVVTVGATLAFTSLTPHMPEYEARTKLLIVAPVSERLLGQQKAGQNPQGLNPLGGTTLSVETLSALATANDLLQRIIAELNLRDPGTGRPWAVEQLAGMITPKVETAGRGSPQLALPLLTLTVRGQDPGLLKDIAEKWAEVFVQTNSQLFATEAARSYDFTLAQYNESQIALRKLGEERAGFVAVNPLALFQVEQELKRAELKENQKTLLDLSAQLALKRQQFTETEAHLSELTVDGRWIGLQHGSGVNPGVQATTPEQAAVLQTKVRLFDLQERVKNFQQSNELSLLKQRLALKRELLAGYITQQEATENNLKAQSRALETLQAQIKQQPQFLVLVKAISDPALWQQLGLNPTLDDWERIRARGLRTEEVNPAFTTLTDRIISTRTNVETERERVNLLTRRVEETRKEVKDLEKDTVEKEEIQLPRLQNELALAQEAYKKQQAIYSDLQAQAIDLRNTIRQIQAQRDEYERLVDAYRADVNALSRRIASAELQIRAFDRENTALETNFGVLAPRLQEARIAKEEQAASIRVVEKAVEPRIPVSTDGRRKVLLLSAVLGLFLGVVLVFLIHYLQGPEGSRRETVPPSPGASDG